MVSFALRQGKSPHPFGKLRRGSIFPLRGKRAGFKPAPYTPLWICDVLGAAFQEGYDVGHAALVEALDAFGGLVGDVRG